MKITSLIQSINKSGAPVVNTAYFTSRETGLAAFAVLVDEVADDYETILLEEFDTETGKTTIIDTFEGNEDF
jgi:hypothetical protein